MLNVNSFIDITPVVDNQLCLSCGACDPICPTNVISFHETIGGLVFPTIDYSGCIECTLCLQVCPGVGFTKHMIENLPEDPFVGEVKTVYVGKSTNKKRYNNSQSGGAVTEFIYWALKRKKIGAVIVTEMQETSNSYPHSKGIIITNPEDLIKTQKSKYVPTPILSAINEVEKLNVDFAVVGISCHIHGLLKLLEKKRKLKKRLKYKVGLICDRVLSYASMDYLIDKTNINEKITEFDFRDKSHKGYPGNVRIKTNMQTKYLQAQERIQIKDFFTPTRCRMCFDKMNIFADITVGDPHKIDDVDKKNGESLIIARNDIGLELIKISVENKGLNIRKINDDYTIGQSIKYKRIEWHSYIKEYKKNAHLVPNYVNHIFNQESLTNLNVNKQISYSTALYQAKNRKQLLKQIRYTIMFNKFKSFIKTIVKYK